MLKTLPNYPEEPLPDWANCWVYDFYLEEVLPAYSYKDDFIAEDGRTIDRKITDHWQIMTQPDYQRILVIGMVVLAAIIIIGEIIRSSLP